MSIPLCVAMVVMAPLLSPRAVLWLLCAGPCVALGGACSMVLALRRRSATGLRERLAARRLRSLALFMAFAPTLTFLIVRELVAPRVFSVQPTLWMQMHRFTTIGSTIGPFAVAALAAPWLILSFRGAQTLPLRHTLALALVLSIVNLTLIVALGNPPRT